jgi:hypothetical protein
MTKWLRHSEYHHALNLARRERRRGNVIGAERWLKHADRQLAIAERLQASIDASTLREAELSAALARESAEREHLLRRQRERAAVEEKLRDFQESFCADYANESS